MGAFVGAIIGYIVGTRSGEEGWTELREAWQVISTSDEVKDLVMSGFSMARDLAAQGSGFLSRALEGSDTDNAMVPAA